LIYYWKKNVTFSNQKITKNRNFSMKKIPTQKGIMIIGLTFRK